MNIVMRIRQKVIFVLSNPRHDVLQKEKKVNCADPDMIGFAFSN